MLPVFDGVEELVGQWLHALLFDSAGAFDEAWTPWSVCPGYLIGCIDGHGSKK